MQSWNWLSRIGSGSILAAGLAASGCATTATRNDTIAIADSDRAALDADQAQAIEEMREHHRHHHHGGIAMFIAMSVDSLGLPDEEQAQVDRIQTNLESGLMLSRAAEQATLSAIIDGVAAGAIDMGRLNAGLARVDAAAANVHAATQNALNDLHAALTPAEREDLVDKVESHWQIWRQVSLEDASVTNEKGSFLAGLAFALDLTEAQIKAIELGLASSPAHDKSGTEKVEAYVKSFAKTFEEEKFDASKLAAANEANLHVARSGEARMAHIYEVVTHVLSPEQRTKLAARLQEHLDATTAAN